MSLKIGIVLNKEQFYEWHKELIVKLQSHKDVELKFIEADTHSAGAEEHVPIISRVAKYLYKKLVDRQAFLKNALAKAEFGKILNKDNISNLPISICKHTLTLNDPVTVNTEKFDYIITLSLAVVDPNLLQHTKKGFFILAEGLYLQGYDQDLVGFWENYSVGSLNVFSLYFLDSQTGNYYKIKESFSSNRPLSLLDSRNGYLWKGVDMLMRTIKSLNIRNQNLSEVTLQNNLFENVANFQSTPNKKQLSYFLMIQLFKKTKALILDKVSNEKWHILIRKGSNVLTQSELHEYKLINSPKGIFWADPFIYEKDGKASIFVEEYLDEKSRAHISVLNLNEELEVIGSTPIIETDYHLSYPFIMDIEDKLYMIPESSENKKVSLYECIEYPTKWVFVRDLISDIAAFDSTLIEHKGKWWLFANVVEQAGVSDWDELYIFHTDDPVNGIWSPHNMNPVVSHTESARPAGKIFLHEGKLLRPSQDSSQRYGYALNFFEITHLDENTYTESLQEKILPTYQRNNLAIHTFNRSQNFSVIDGLFRKIEF